MSNSPPSPGPDLFFAGGECLTRYGVWVRRTDMDLEAATRETATRDSDATAIGRDGILRTWDPDEPRAEWLNEIDLDATRNVLDPSSRFYVLSPWFPVRAAFVRGQVAPDLTRGATRLVADAATGTHYMAHSSLVKAPNAQITVSIFVKAAGANGVQLICSATDALNGVRVTFPDIANVSPGSGLTAFGAGWTADDATIEEIGGGWVRCSLTGTSDALEDFRFDCVLANDGATSFTGEGLALVVWGAQAEFADAPSAYQATPRDTDRKFPSLLLEQARTNAWTFSEELDNGVWTKTACTITADATTAPDGAATADKIVESVTLAQHRVERIAPTTSDDADQAFSFYAKAAERSWIRVQMVTKDNVNPAGFFDVGNGVVGSAAAGLLMSITELPDGWFRCETVYNVGNGGVTPSNIIGLAESDGGHSYQGDGVSGAFVWGVQFEVDVPDPSSYIATAGVTVTRADDEFQAPYPPPPQPFSAYVKFIESGTLSASLRLYHIGSTSTSFTPYFDLRSLSGAYRIDYHNGDQLVATGLTTEPIATGDLVEMMATMDPEGLVRLHLSVNGGAVQIQDADPNPIPAEWADQRLWINSLGAVSEGWARFLALKAHRGVRSLDFMRAL